LEDQQFELNDLNADISEKQNLIGLAPKRQPECAAYWQTATATSLPKARTLE